MTGAMTGTYLLIIESSGDPFGLMRIMIKNGSVVGHCHGSDGMSWMDRGKKYFGEPDAAVLVSADELVERLFA